MKMRAVRRAAGPLQQVARLLMQSGRHAGRRKKTLPLRKGRAPHEQGRMQRQARRLFFVRQLPPHLRSHGQGQMPDPAGAGGPQTGNKACVGHEQRGFTPPGQTQAGEQMPGIVHKPEGHRHAQGPAEIEQPPLRVQPAQIDGEQQGGSAPGQQLFPGAHKLSRIPARRHGFQHRPETGRAQSLAQFQVQQMPIRAGQQRGAASAQFRRLHCSPLFSQQCCAQASQQRPPEIRGQTQARPVKQHTATSGQLHSLFTGDAPPMSGESPFYSGLRGLQPPQGFRFLQPENIRIVTRKGQFPYPPRSQPQQKQRRARPQAFPGCGSVRQAQNAPGKIGQADALRHSGVIGHGSSQKTVLPA